MSNEPVDFCFDRILIRDLHRGMLRVPQEGERAIAVKKRMWPNGSSLSIRFLTGKPEEQALVESVAREWLQHANLTFDFGAGPRSEIRVGFDQSLGSWSAVGTDCLDIETFPLDRATMNFSRLDQGVILHEFGHAIGLCHEHQNPQGGIQWNEPVVIEALKQPPNCWPEEISRHNVLRRYAFDQCNSTAFDRDSIMLYAFPAGWTLNGTNTHANHSLSAMDKAFIASESAYPRRAQPQEALVVELPVNVNKITSADIGRPGEEDLYLFHAEEGGYFQIETLGHTNMYMRLFGPDNRTLLLDEDDDSGQDFNARITRKLEPGEYLVQIRHSDLSNGAGDYGIRVKTI